METVQAEQDGGRQAERRNQSQSGNEGIRHGALDSKNKKIR
jgi:hypothetical protein